MPKFDRPTFFAFARKSPFGNRLTPEQVRGMDAILDHWDHWYASLDIRFLAYILATSFHETGGRMVPVREGFGKTDAASRKIVAGYKYGKPDPETGHVYYGRGHVQLTHKENYARMGDFVGADLVSNPELALDPEISLEILFEGMLLGASGKGDFTGKSLEDYFSDKVDDPVGARRIVNGTDKAQLIASYHKAFLDSLRAAMAAVKAPNPEVKPEDTKADSPSLLTDKTILGALVTSGGGAAAALVAAIQNPYALAAFAVIAVGLFLVFTGRIEIKTKAGA